MAASMIEDPTQARAKLRAVCLDFARYHPRLGADIAECAYEIAWLALDDDPREAREAAMLALATETTGGSAVELGFAKAALELLSGDSQSIRSFATLQLAEEAEATAWWHDFYAADAAVGEALARQLYRRGDLETPRRLFAKAEALYRKIEKALPAPVFARRIASLERIHGNRGK